jgi:hypothetical protein
VKPGQQRLNRLGALKGQGTELLLLPKEHRGLACMRQVQPQGGTVQLPNWKGCQAQVEYCV